jgi:hypothetical protein
MVMFLLSGCCLPLGNAIGGAKISARDPIDFDWRCDMNRADGETRRAYPLVTANILLSAAQRVDDGVITSL